MTLSKLLGLYELGKWHDCRSIICRLNQIQVTELGNLAKAQVCISSKLIRQFNRIIVDLCNHYKTRSVTFRDFRNDSYKVNNNKVDNKLADFVPIKFVSKEIEGMNLNRILNDQEALKIFPSKHLRKKYQNDEFKFSTCFSYDNAIRCDITKKFYVLNRFLTLGVSVICTHYPDYVHPTVQHVVTGDVNIVKNKVLRKTFKKGFGYIEPIYKDKLLIFNSIKSDLKTYVNKLANKHSITHHYFHFTVQLILIRQHKHKSISVKI